MNFHKVFISKLGRVVLFMIFLKIIIRFREIRSVKFLSSNTLYFKIFPKLISI
jgi:hypothetical protein